MDLTKIILNSINTFKEIDILKKELSELPQDYKPFNLEDRHKIGAMLFAERILLSPMIGKNDIYNGTISHPKSSSENESTLSGAQFKYQGRIFMLYRTEAKHRNP